MLYAGGYEGRPSAGTMAARIHDKDCTARAAQDYDLEGEHETVAAARR